MHVKLKVLRGASSGKEIAIRGPRFFIGRSPECNLRANSDAISRKHCAITVSDTGVTIRDLGSRNGTYVNGSRINGEHRIKMGDQLRVGPLEFLVTHAGTAKPATPQRVASDSAVSSDTEMDGLVSDWLEEADQSNLDSNVIGPETREYKAPSGETDKLTVDVDKKNAVPDSTADTNATKTNATKTNSSDTGRLPKRVAPKKNSPKDTQEAAAQMLRKFFNRG